jgi:hypothetical protein
VVNDVGTRTSSVSARYAFVRNTAGEFLGGAETVARLVEEATVAVNQFVPAEKRTDTLKLLPLDRGALVLWASRGRNITAYSAANGLTA